MAYLIYYDDQHQVENILRYIEQEWQGVRWSLKRSHPHYALFIYMTRERLARFKLQCPHQAKDVEYVDDPYN